MNLYVDIHGVMLDFVSATTEAGYSGCTDFEFYHNDFFWEHVKRKASFWKGMSGCRYAYLLLDRVKSLKEEAFKYGLGVDVQFLTAIPRQWKTVFNATEFRMRDLFMLKYKIVRVDKAEDKARLSVDANGTASILIDDFADTCSAFNSAGGVALHYKLGAEHGCFATRSDMPKVSVFMNKLWIMWLSKEGNNFDERLSGIVL